MKVGCHVSISGGVDRAVDNAVERKCLAFQIFTRNPRGWRAKELGEMEISEYRRKIDASDIDRYATCAHMPYLPNLASTNSDAHQKSVDTLVGEVRRCGDLGIPYLVTHLGSHLGAGEDAGIRQLVMAYTKAAGVRNDVTILLENTAGQKNSVGSEFGQLGSILSQLEPQERFGVCIDTCHAFVYGYDLRTPDAVRETFARFDDAVGFERLKILHLNDARGEMGSRLDRHYHIGLGHIGMEGIGAVARLADKKGIPIILETPIDDTRDDFENIRIVKGLT